MTKSTRWIDSNEFYKRALATYGYALVGAMLFWVPLWIILMFLVGILES